MRFQLTPRSMTLNCFKFEFLENFTDLGGNNSQTKGRPVSPAIAQPTECTFQHSVPCVDLPSIS